MSDRDRLRRAFDEQYDLRPDPGLRHRAIQHAVSGGREHTPRAWGFALAGAIALLVIGVLLGPRLLQGAQRTPIGQQTPTPAPTASAPVPPGPSPQLIRPTFAYAPTARTSVLFGSASPSDLTGQTWLWDGTHWARVAGDQPPARTMATAAYDGHGIVLFGGQGACPASGPGPCPTLGDTWTFDGHTWHQVHPSHSPAPAVGALATWDPTLGKAVLVVDAQDGTETWTWDGADWSQVAAPVRGGFSAVGGALGYDPVSRRVVFYGQLVRLNSPTSTPVTWTFDGRQWTQLAAGQPGVRQFPVFGDDGSHLYLFGGADANGQTLNDTWVWQGSSWQPVPTANRPPPRTEARMASGPGLVILYGGAASETQTNAAALADTWSFDSRDWTQRAG